MQAALDGIDLAGLKDAVVPLEPRRATEAELVRVHQPAYLGWLREFCAGGGGELDHDTFVSPGSWDTALLAAGGVLAAIDALVAGPATWRLSRPVPRDTTPWRTRRWASAC